MVVIWGRPIEYTSFESIQTTWQDCLDQCFEEDTCVFLEKTENGCNLYRFGNVSVVEKLEKSSGVKMAIKVNMENEMCPLTDAWVSSQSSYYAYQDATMNYTTTITPNASLLYFSFNATSLFCPPGSQYFVRGNLTVCLQIRLFPDPIWCGDYSNALDLCKEGNGLSITGPGSLEEWQYILAQTTNSTLKAVEYPEIYTNHTFKVWLDGWSKYTAGEFVYEDDTHFEKQFYTFGYHQPDGTTKDFCLHLRYRTSDAVDDSICKAISGISSAYSEKYCLRGAVCRIQPKI